MKQTLFFAFLLLASSARATDLDVVRQQFADYYTAAGSDVRSPRMIEALAALESTTYAITTPGFLLSDGTWSDINYSETPDGGWGPWDHSRRLIVMAKAYQTPGQVFYRSATLRGQIHASLESTKRFYGTNILPLGNWWFWTIGIPIDLGPTLVLMRDDMDPALYAELVKAIRLRIGTSPTARGIVGPVPVGQNLVWSSFTHLCLGLLENNAAMLASVRDAMASVARPAVGDGIKGDRSFHQHGAQLYTGGYGGSFANDVARYALLTRNTLYALPSDALASFSDYVADGIAWSLYGNYFDVSVISREVARPTTTGFNGIAALLQASQFDSPRKTEIRSAAAKMLRTWGGAFPTELAGLAVKLEASGAIATWPSGHRHYYNSDYTVHRRPDWFASVKMFSTRTKSGEDTNDENIRGSRQSDGRFYLVIRGNEYFGNDVWPALDWTRLPGTTVEQKPDAASNAYGYGTRTFAGGTGDGRNGVSAMELAPLQSSLTARKAYFFFDDSILFLSNSITSPSANRVETIINQWPLTSMAPLVMGPRWAFLDNVGYWLPMAAKNERTTRTGSWASLGGSSDMAERTKSFETLWIDHGVAPMNATAEYAIVPNVTQSAMAAWAAAPPLAILANNDTVSAARDLRTGVIGITFWRAGSVAGIQSSAPAVVYLDGRNLYAADPNANATGTFQITVPGYARVTIAKNGGKTTHVMLTNRRRAVR
jgi:chondroitin AC lyase